MAIFMGLILPQALASPGYGWARTKRRLAQGLTLLIVPLTFFLISNVFWRLKANAIETAGHYVCGAFGAAAVLSTIYGTLIHMVFGVIMFVVVGFVWKRKAKRKELGSR